MARVVKFTADNDCDLYLCPDLIFSVRQHEDKVYVVSITGFGYLVKDSIEQVLGAWKD